MAHLFGDEKSFGDDSSSGRGTTPHSMLSESFSDGPALILPTSAPASIQYPLEGAWSEGEGIRTPRSARSTRTRSAMSNNSRPSSSHGDRLVITPAFDEPPQQLEYTEEGIKTPMSGGSRPSSTNGHQPVVGPAVYNPPQQSEILFSEKL